MSDGSAIEYFHVYPLTWAEIQTLPDDHQAALSVACCAVTEVNALMKLHIFSGHKLPEQNLGDYAILTQQFVLLRTWSAKLFEAYRFIRFKGTKKKMNDPVLLDISRRAIEKFESLRNGKGYELARAIRNEASNHYSFDDGKKNLKHVSKNAHCSMYLHEMNGNSVFPLGEEVMFMGRLNRAAASLRTKEERMTMLNTWIDWNLEATDWLTAVHSDIVKKLVLAVFPDRYAHRRLFYMPHDYVGTKDVDLTPLFLRVNRN